MSWNPRAKRWLRNGLYVVGYALALVVFAYVAFPYGRLKQFLVAEFNGAQGPSGSRLAVEKLTWSMHFPGVVATGVELRSGVVKDDAKPSLPLRLDEVRATVSPLSFLVGNRVVSFALKGLGGNSSGRVGQNAAGRRVSVNMESLELGRIPQVGDALGVPLHGAISGAVRLDVPEGKWSKADGAIELAVDGMTVGAPASKIMGLLPAIDLGALSLRAESTNGRVKVSELTANGKDLSLSATGSVRLRDRWRLSLAELDANLEFSTSYRSRDESTKVVFEQPSAKIPSLFDTTTSRYLSKTKEGQYQTRVVGPLAKPSVRPAVSKNAAASSRSRRRSRTRRTPRAVQTAGAQSQ